MNLGPVIVRLSGEMVPSQIDFFGRPYSAPERVLCPKIFTQVRE